MMQAEAQAAKQVRMGLWLRQDGNALLCAFAAVYVLLYLLFWPQAVTTMDEAAYMNLAYALQHGTVYLDAVHASPVQSYMVGAHRLSLYPPGMGAMLVLPSLLGGTFAQGFNLFVHLALFVLVVKFLRRNQTPGLFGLLYLLHPVAALFSRTVMSDLPASLLVTLAFWVMLQKRYFVCGVVLGVSVLIRTVSLLSAVLFGAGMLVDALLDLRVRATGAGTRLWERATPIVWLAAGVIPFAAGAWVYQKVVQDGGWAKYAQAGMISPRYLPQQFPFYAVALLVLYPGMLFAPFLYRGVGRFVLLFVTMGFFAFYSCYYFHDETANRLETFLVGQRFMLVIVPLLIVAYSEVLWRLVFSPNRVPARFQKALAGTVGAVLLVGAAAIHRRHAGYLRELTAIRTAVEAAAPEGSPLLCNIHVAKLLLPQWASHRGTNILMVAGTNPENIADAERTVRSALDAQKPGGAGVTIAVWSRPYRPETPTEQAVVRALQADFATQPLDGAASPPPDLSLLHIVGEKKAKP